MTGSSPRSGRGGGGVAYAEAAPPRPSVRAGGEAVVRRLDQADGSPALPPARPQGEHPGGWRTRRSLSPKSKAWKAAMSRR
ncbi:hypothetical protein [Nonomuraea jabiensis]|uniref:hypothetical protein n=1 Tax=Nonomuraea jabiensis TaxID=882448 RepID=UPI00367C566E